jgi:hypothetical protein
MDVMSSPWTETVTRVINFRQVGKAEPVATVCLGPDEVAAFTPFTGAIPWRRPFYSNHIWLVPRQEVAFTSDGHSVHTEFVCRVCGERIYEERWLRDDETSSDELPRAPETVLDMNGNPFTEAA